MNEQLPRVTLHYAQTLDGRIATRSGQSQWIGGDASLRFAHELRASHHAVMVGIGTVLADNPRLTVRRVPGCSPVRVVLDSQLRTPLAANILRDPSTPTIVATTNRAPIDRWSAIADTGARVLPIRADREGRVDLVALLGQLAAEALDSVLIEGGATLITSALHAGVVDRLVVCIAPKIVGTGIEGVGNLGVERLSDAVTFQEARFTHLDGDLIFEGRLRAPRNRPR